MPAVQQILKIVPLSDGSPPILIFINRPDQLKNRLKGPEYCGLNRRDLKTLPSFTYISIYLINVNSFEIDPIRLNAPAARRLTTIVHVHNVQGVNAVLKRRHQSRLFNLWFHMALTGLLFHRHYRRLLQGLRLGLVPGPPAGPGGFSQLVPGPPTGPGGLLSLSNRLLQGLRLGLVPGPPAGPGGFSQLVPGPPTGPGGLLSLSGPAA
jgi:hypothetical protein